MAESIRRTTRSLRARNFRLHFTGQGLSLVGTWMQRIAMAWLVYRLTGSAFVLGLVGFVGRIPTLLLAALVLTGVVEVWHVIVLATLLGVLDAFDIPAWQAFFIRLTDDPADLGNAIALNSSPFNLARLVGRRV